MSLTGPQNGFRRFASIKQQRVSVTIFLITASARPSFTYGLVAHSVAPCFRSSALKSLFANSDPQSHLILRSLESVLLWRLADESRRSPFPPAFSFHFYIRVRFRFDRMVFSTTSMNTSKTLKNWLLLFSGRCQKKSVLRSRMTTKYLFPYMSGEPISHVSRCSCSSG